MPIIWAKQFNCFKDYGYLHWHEKMEKEDKEFLKFDHGLVILKQKFTSDHKTIYSILNNVTGEMFDMFAYDIYNNNQLLPQFSADDIRNICYSAILENEIKQAEKAENQNQSE